MLLNGYLKYKNMKELTDDDLMMVTGGTGSESLNVPCEYLTTESKCKANSDCEWFEGFCISAVGEFDDGVVPIEEARWI